MKPARPPRRVAAAALAVAVTFLAACGGDDDATSTSSGSIPSTQSSPTNSSGASTGSTDTTTRDSTDSTGTSTPAAGSVSDNKADYVDALAGNITTDDRDVATCIATAIVDAIGFDKIHDSGLSPSAFAEGSQLDEKGLALQASQAGSLKDAFVACGNIAEAYISAESSSEAQKACERGVLTNDVVADLLATQLTRTQPSAELKAALDGAQKCQQSEVAPATTSS
jgi:hypothetical protein